MWLCVVDFGPCVPAHRCQASHRPVRLRSCLCGVHPNPLTACTAHRSQASCHAPSWACAGPPPLLLPSPPPCTAHRSSGSHCAPHWHVPRGTQRCARDLWEPPCGPGRWSGCRCRCRSPALRRGAEVRGGEGRGEAGEGGATCLGAGGQAAAAGTAAGSWDEGG